jgi:hypothetical protein
VAILTFLEDVPVVPEEEEITLVMASHHPSALELWTHKSHNPCEMSHCTLGLPL